MDETPRSSGRKGVPRQNCGECRNSEGWRLLGRKCSCGVFQRCKFVSLVCLEAASIVLVAYCVRSCKTGYDVTEASGGLDCQDEIEAESEKDRERDISQQRMPQDKKMFYMKEKIKRDLRVTNYKEDDGSSIDVIHSNDDEDEEGPRDDDPDLNGGEVDRQ